MTNTPTVFLVRNLLTEEVQLVRALTRAAARRHASEKAFEVRRATVDDVTRLLPSGAVIETAKSEVGLTLE